MSQAEINHNEGGFFPIGSVLLGLISFSAMDAVMKSLSLSIGPYNAILWRYAVGLIIITAIFAFQRPSWPKPDILKVHILRSIIIVFMAYLFSGVSCGFLWLRAWL